jgi:hypothetical protein
MAEHAAGHPVTEPDRIRTRLIVWIGVVCVAVVGIFMGSLGVMIWLFEPSHRPPLTALETRPIVPPAPRLQANPYIDLSQLKGREQGLLEHYGWVDKAHGMARIPIAKAIDRAAGQPIDPPNVRREDKK